jgi:hypothetical protein
VNEKLCSLLRKRVENGEVAVIFTVVSATPRTQRIGECCRLLTLSKIPRTIGVSIGLMQLKYAYALRNPVSRRNRVSGNTGS